MRYCRMPEIDRIVSQLVQQGWQFRRGRKHGRLYAPLGCGVLTVPGTPSDRRAWLNFRRDVRKLAQHTDRNLSTPRTHA